MMVVVSSPHRIAAAAEWSQRKLNRPPLPRQKIRAPQMAPRRCMKPTTATAKTAAGIQLPSKSITRRPAHYGLDIQFEDRPDDIELGRLTESTVWVNRAHPAYRRAQASHSVGYHIALAVAMALAPLAVEAPHQHGFVSTFLSRWGEAIDKAKPRSRR